MRKIIFLNDLEDMDGYLSYHESINDPIFFLSFHAPIFGTVNIFGEVYPCSNPHLFMYTSLTILPRYQGDCLGIEKYEFWHFLAQNCTPTSQWELILWNGMCLGTIARGRIFFEMLCMNFDMQSFFLQSSISTFKECFGRLDLTNSKSHETLIKGHVTSHDLIPCWSWWKMNPTAPKNHLHANIYHRKREAKAMEARIPRSIDETFLMRKNEISMIKIEEVK